ncbi:MAG: M28 family peptidase [Proteobacteria bacterium]|nr:M28 family peptidase [Pseudomonadota bacterium]
MKQLTGFLSLSLATSLAIAQALAPISKQRLREDVRVLSADEFQGRGPGQAGDAKTVEYLAKQFAAAGLQPGGSDGSWFQEVPLRVFERQPAVGITLKTRGGGARSLTAGKDITLSSHNTGHNQVIDAPIVFIGYGIKAPDKGWDNFAGVDLHGKVALVLANDPDFEATPDSPAYGKFDGKAMVYGGRFGAKVAAAQAAGAAAVLVIHEDAAASYPWRQVANGDRIASMEITSTPTQATATTAATPAAPANPANGAGVSSAISGWLQWQVASELLASAGFDLQQLKIEARKPEFHWRNLDGAFFSAEFTMSSHDIVSRNVVARLPGGKRPEEFVLYGAHWDANGKGAPDESGDDIRNGAVDNATGTAELLEVARTFSRGRRPDRTLIFIAYAAEEKGLLGSEYYAGHPLYPLEHTAAVINLDPHVMLGKARDIELVGAGRTDLEDALARAAAAEGMRLEIEPHPEAGWYFRSDHYSFAKRGVPSLSFRVGRDLFVGGLAAGTARSEDYNVNRYHQPKDEFDPKWTFEGTAQETAVAVRIGAEIANSSHWPAWKPGAEFLGIRAGSDNQRR